MRARIALGLFMGITFLGWGCSISSVRSVDGPKRYETQGTIERIESHERQKRWAQFVYVKTDDGTWFTLPMLNDEVMAFPAKVESTVIFNSQEGSTFTFNGSTSYEFPIHGILRYHDCGDGIYCFDSFTEKK